MVNAQELVLVQHQIQMDEAELKLRSLKIKRWLKIDELALYLGSTREAVKKAYQRGRYPGQVFNRRIYFNREVIDQLIENSTGVNIQVSPVHKNKRRLRWR